MAQSPRKVELVHSKEGFEAETVPTHANVLSENSSVLSTSTTESVTEVENSIKKKMVATMESGRERLKRHRVEVAGRVWIPDMWGQEELLKDWIDCTKFDASLVNSSIMSARDALAAQAVAAAGMRRQQPDHSGPRVLRLENTC